jgi:hypothetical protein
VRTVVALVVGAAALIAVQYLGRTAQGVILVVLGAGCLIWAVARDPHRLRADARETSGPGWWIGRLIAKLPGTAAKIVFSLIAIGMIALGAWVLAAG